MVILFKWLVMVEYEVRHGTPDDLVYAEASILEQAEPQHISWGKASPYVSELTPQEKKRLSVSLTKAYESLNRQKRKIDIPIMSNHFTRLNYNRLRSFLSSGHERVLRVPLSHNLHPYFYPPDGNIFVANDRGAKWLEMVVAKDRIKKAIFQEEDHKLTMVKKEGRWFIHADEITAIKSLKLPKRKPLAGYPFFKGINYYPQKAPWQKFWREFPLATIKRDFAILKRLKVNSLRIFLPFAQFHSSEKVVYTERLKTFLDLCRKAGFHTVVTFWDSIDYAYGNWPFYLGQLDSISMILKDYRDIVSIDLKNEADLDFPLRGREKVMGLLRAGLFNLAKTAPEIPVTIGWSTGDQAHLLAAYLDYVSFHDYAEPKGFSGRVANLAKKVGPKPILLSEFGLPSWNSFLWPHGHSQEEQAYYYSKILNGKLPKQFMGHMAWTLYDFPEVPGWVANSYLPWKVESQKEMGLYIDPNEPKLAAKVFHDPASFRNQKLSWWKVWFKPFRVTLMVVGVFGLYLLIHRRRVYLRDQMVNRDIYEKHKDLK